MPNPNDPLAARRAARAQHAANVIGQHPGAPPVQMPQSAPALQPVPARSLRELEAQLSKVVRVETTDIETEEGDCKGKYCWRDETGHAFFWSPYPYRYEMHDVDTVAQADEIMFLCPLCFAKNGGAVGTHSVLVTFAGRNVPDDAGSRDSSGKPSRWTILSGATIDDLCLSPSILLTIDKCGWHGFVGMNGIPAGHAG
jgi:hypothetical protein